MTTEIYAYLSDKHLYHVVSLQPSPNIVTVLVTPADLVASEIPQVVEKKVVGDTGFEPATSTVCKTSIMRLFCSVKSDSK